MYTIKDLRTSFRDVTLSPALKIRGEEIREISLADVAVVLSKDGKEAEGKGQVLLSDVWSMAGSDIPHAGRDFMMRAMLNAKCSMATGDKYLRSMQNPLEHHLAAYKKALEIGSAMGLPQLAVNNSISPFDMALWQAFAGLNNRELYDCLDAKTLDMDLSDELGEHFEVAHFDSCFHSPNTAVRILHTFGGGDSFESLEGYIGREGISAVKIKLKGDVDWDTKRVIAVTELMKSRYGDNFTITVDPNDSYKGADQLAIFLERLRSQEKYAFGKLQYVEQPTSRNLDAPNQDMHYVVKEFGKPIIMDEMVSDHKAVLRAIEMGWNGIALKPTAKVFSETLLELAIARERGIYVCIQDLTNPGLALVHHLDFARRVVAENDAVEANARQYIPKDVADSVMPAGLTSLYTVKDGKVDASVIK